MARIVVFQHNAHAHAGRLGRMLRDHGFRLDIRRTDLDPGSVPTDLDDVHGLIILGGAQNVDEGHDFLAREQSFIREVHAANLPVVGVCLGAQQIAVALGGQVGRMPVPEVGVLPVNLTVPGQTETMLAGVPWKCPQLQSHGYEITTLPPGAALLASSPVSKNQCFRAGLRTFGFQYHFECDIPMSVDMIDRSLHLAEPSGLDRAALIAQLNDNGEMFDRAADRVCLNLTTYAFTFDELFAV